MRSVSEPAKFFDGFAEVFDTVYIEKRNFFVQWVNHRFQSNMFT